ncbi:MAG TPA: glycosyltransferase 87 family protein [Solirubrobacteraceae bacterium]|nr:glycosyltransferase 87 family protein [Solirubrobacteraceae bacterium]
MVARTVSIALSCALALGIAAAPVAATASSTAASSPTTTAADPEAPIPVVASDTPPIGRTLSSNRVLEIAGALPKMRAVRARYRGSYGGAYLKGPARWQVSYFSKRGKEVGQVIIADRNGRVLEQWTGFQIAWSMARGYPGAFGKHVNALYIWIPLCVLFFLPFFDWHKPLRLLHLDLLVLLSFSVSLAFFNHGRIYASTPLAYPPLVYLLVRMLLLARVGRHSPDRADPKPIRLLVPAPWLAVGVVFLIGFRVGLNVTDSNVIDVGYAGVIGAQRIVHDKVLYGGYPTDNEHGDTYGPVNYEAYVPFQRVFGWSGRWDDLPAAHAAAIVFDLLAVALLFLLGRRVRGPALGIALAYAWVSYPFTLFTLESNSNDSLVAALVLVALLACSPRWRVASSSPVRGVFAALAGLTKFAPLALAPLLCTHGLAGIARARRVLAVALFAGAFLLTAAIVSVPALTHDSLHTIFQRTFAYQADRESPFSIWGLYGGKPSLEYVQAAVQGAALALAVSVAILPRRADLVGLAATAAAVLVAVQLGIDHWFYLYIPWFFGLAMLALLGQLSWSGSGSQARAVPSESARSNRLATA